MQLKIYRLVFLSIMLFVVGCLAVKPTEPNRGLVATPSVSTSSHASETFTNSIGMEFVLIPAGKFMMGSTDGDDDEKPRHEVTIAKPFYMGKYEVTQAQWEKVMGNNPAYFKGLRNPVESVSWDDVQAFIKRLNALEQTDKYHLPSEAEWEYAARAGTQTAYSFGDDETQLGDYAWYNRNSEGKAHPVGEKKPNPWGLYDMHGNVWEWCQDVWHNDYKGASTDGSAWTSGGEQGKHLLRGGSWSDITHLCRSADRSWVDPRNFNSGFRLSCSN